MKLSYASWVLSSVLMTTVTLLSVFNSSTRAQQLSHFPHPCWQQKGVFQWDFNVNNIVVRNVVTYISDTAVCGRTYKKLLQEQNSWGTVDSTDLFVLNLNGRVFLSYAPNCVDTGLLTFDFNLIPGDTFVKNNGLSDFTDTVASVSTMIIDGVLRKKIHFTFATWDVWIDGIGDSTRGLLNQNVGFEGAHYELICQRDSGGIVFVNSKPPYPVDSTGFLHLCDSIEAAEPCQIANGLPHTEENTLVRIYPNPSNGFLHIAFPDNHMGSTFSIADPLGREVFDGLITAPVMPVDFQSFRNGVYFLRVTNGSNIRTQKLLIQ